MNLTFRIYTFGCKVNQYNSEIIRTNLIEKGYSEKKSNPDFIIINMCSLTSNAVRKTRLLINRIKRENPFSRIVLTGCIEDDNALPVDYRIHVRDKERLFDIFDISEPVDYLRDFSGHTRAFIKIQEGCTNFCTYCIVPLMRDRMYSKSAGVFRKELQGLAGSGFKEIVLTGTHINRYNNEGNNISDLIDIIEKQDGIERFRISSIEPNEMDDDFLLSIMKSEKFCPHLHLSVQSGSDRILSLMERRYTIEKVKNIIGKLREIRDFEWSSDFIVGFPGESEKDFQETVEFIKEFKPVFMHVFPFSKRKGTKAYDMKEYLSEKDKKERAAILRELEGAVSREVFSKYTGKTLEVLVEKEEDGYYTGYSQNYIKLYMEKNNNIIRENIYCVKCIDVFRDGLLGRIV